MRLRGTLFALVWVLVLAMPAPALAQSAGDNQYTDPFSHTPSSHGGGSSGKPGGSSGTSPQTAQAAPTGPSASASRAPQPSQAGELPRTGFPVALPLAYGLVLLLSGVALRRGVRPRIR
jgi:hypothetical protein